MKNEIVTIGLAGCIVGVLVPVVVALVHGLKTATPLLAYTIPIFIVGLILIFKGSKMPSEPQEDSTLPSS